MYDIKLKLLQCNQIKSIRVKVVTIVLYAQIREHTLFSNTLPILWTAARRHRMCNDESWRFCVTEKTQAIYMSKLMH